VILLWLIVAAGTCKEVLYGRIIEAPCLREMEKARNSAIKEERQDA
jgi:hypothetical protein